MIPKTRRQLTREVAELRDRVTGLEHMLADLTRDGRIVVNVTAGEPRESRSARLQRERDQLRRQRNREFGAL